MFIDVNSKATERRIKEVSDRLNEFENGGEIVADIHDWTEEFE